MKIKKLILILLFLNFNVFAYDTSNNISLNDFAKKVSFEENINIYIDQDLNASKISYSIPNTEKNISLFSLFKNTLLKNGYILKKYGNIYHVNKIINYKNSHIYKLNYNSFEDCKRYLDIEGIKYDYLSNINSLIIYSDYDRYISTKKILKQIDVKKKQAILKLVIFEFTDSDVKDFGLEHEASYINRDKGATMALNTILTPLDTETQIFKSFTFYSALKFLNKNSVINFKQYPYLLVKNNQDFKFEAVENIPYLEKTTKTESSNYSEQTSVTYKDVGLKINGKTLIYDDYISLDLDLIIEDIIEQYEVSNTPKTFKRHLQSKTNISYNQVLVLSGLKRNKVEHKLVSIPLLSNIPYLGEIFKYKYKNESVMNITIAIEILYANNENNKNIKSILQLDSLEFEKKIKEETEN